MAQTSSHAAQRSLGHEIANVGKKLLLAIAVIWASLHLFEYYLATQLGLKHIHLQITITIITIILSIIAITTIRRLLKRTSDRIGVHISALISFFVIATVSLAATLVILDEWGFDLQSLLIGGGVAAVVIGIAVSTILGNILSGGLMLTTFPAKIGDPILIVNDNIHGTVGEVTFMYTKIRSDAGAEYIVPNSAIVQGNVRLMKETRPVNGLPFSKNEIIEVVAANEKYGGVVTKMTPQFTFLSSTEGKEIVLSNASILAGKYVIVKTTAPASSAIKTTEGD